MARLPLLMILALATAPGCAPGVADVEVEENPNSTISAFVRWSTDEPATSVVQFGEHSPSGYYVQDDELVTDHELLVYGMVANTEYHLQVTSVTGDGTEMTSPALTHTTGGLPFGDLVTEVLVYDEAQVEPGWTLSNIAIGSINYPPTAVMFNFEGEVVWYHQHGTTDGRADIQATLVDDDHILMGAGIPSFEHPVEVDLAGNIVWEGPEQGLDNDFIADGVMHHQFHRVDNGDYVTLIYEGKDGIFHDIIEQFDADLNSTWRWAGEDHIADDYSIYPWGNAVEVDFEDNATYYNCRMVSMLHKLDRTTGDVIWRFGEDGDFEPDPSAVDPFQHEAHAPELQPNGNILFYDNGGAARSYSRAVEFELHEDDMTSRIAWEYPGEADDFWSTFAMGDADRLANGNTLITAGTLIDVDTPTRIMEVTAAGEKVWDLRLSGVEEDQLAGGHMSERIPVMIGVGTPE